MHHDNETALKKTEKKREFSGTEKVHSGSGIDPDPQTSRLESIIRCNNLH